MGTRRISLLYPVLGFTVLAVVGVIVPTYLHHAGNLAETMTENDLQRARQVMETTREVIGLETDKVAALGKLLRSTPELMRGVAQAGQGESQRRRLAADMDQLFADLDTDVLVATDAAGVVLHRARGSLEWDHLGAVWGFAEVLYGSEVLTVATGDTGMAILALAPVRQGEDVVGTMVVGKMVDSRFVERIKQTIGWDVSFCDARHVLATSLPAAETEAIDPAVLSAVLQDKTFRRVELPERNRTVYYDVIELVDETGCLVLSADTTEPMAALAAKRDRVLQLGGIVLVVALSLGLGFGIWLIRPLRRLASQVSATASDLLGADLAVTDHNEIQRLVTVFEGLSQALGFYQQQAGRDHDEIQAQKEKAEKANRAKSEFLSTMSHEIRTPLTAILGFADLLNERDPSAAERRDHLSAIQKNGRHLLSIINDILDISKVEAGQLVTEVEGFSPVELVAEVVELIEVRAAGKGITIHAEYPDPLPIRIHSDRLRLKQILVNLVGNAIKFTDEGDITIVTSVPPQQGPPQISFAVRDTGLGMTPEIRARLFQPFCQGDATMSRKYGGTGLGLTISKRLAELLGGNIVVESQPGLGSTFTVTVAAGDIRTVPVRPAAEHIVAKPEDASAEPTPHLHGSILVAEDNAFNQRLVQLGLEAAGLTVTIAENGRIACDLAETAANEGQPFDLVLMDLMMPEMDGFEATRTLRRMGMRMPIVALTANAMAEDRAAALSAGCNAFATKPFRNSELLATIGNCLTGMSTVEMLR